MHALWVVIFSMLVSSGIGSNYSRRILGKSEGRLIKALGLRRVRRGAAGAGCLDAARTARVAAVRR